MRRGRCRAPLVFLLGSVCLRRTSPTVSSEADYKMVFSEELPWPDAETELQYSSARKFFLVGDTHDAAANLASLRRKLQRGLHGARISPGVWAQLESVVLTRQAELALWHNREGKQERPGHQPAISLLTSALQVCLNASQAIGCTAPWSGVGKGSCCAIAATLTAALQASSAEPTGGAWAPEEQTARMARLAQRLTPQPPRRLPPPFPAPAGTQTRAAPTPASQRPVSDEKVRAGGEGARRSGGADVERIRVTLVTTATGPYNRFVDPLVESAKRFFLAGVKYDVYFVVFTDAPPPETRQARVTYVYRRDFGWPLTAMLRYQTFLDCWHLLAHAHFVFSIDVDCLFVAPVGDEILADTVATVHADNAYYDGSELTGPSTSMANGSKAEPSHWSDPALRGLMWHQAHVGVGSEAEKPGGVSAQGFWPAPAVYETRNESCAFIGASEGTRYYYSGFFGGRRHKVYVMLRAIARCSDADLARGIIARVHDESHVNRFWASFPPARVLTAAYMYPEAAILRHRTLCRRRSPGLLRQAGSAREPFPGGSASAGVGQQHPQWCPRDHMHPWLWRPFEPHSWDSAQGWSPELWGSTPLFVPRILNVAKAKDKLIQSTPPAPQDSRGMEKRNAEAGHLPTNGGAENKEGKVAEVSRWTVWSADMHIGPASDLKQIWRADGIEMHDESLSAHCYRTGTCASTLRVLTPHNAMTLGDDTDAPVRELFFRAYRDDSLMRRMDAVVCSHPAAGCELYLPLGVPIILFLTTRFDLGRLYSPAALARWVQAVRAIAGAGSNASASFRAAPPGVVVANNEYDARYVEYFTGVRAEVLPSLCRTTGGARWAWPPPRPTVLLDICDDTRCPPFRQQAMRKLMAALHQAHSSRPLPPAGQTRWPVAALRDVYAHYTMNELSQHAAIVLFPYQVSVMSLFERRAMGIPMFAPSLALLTEWHMRYGVVFERRVDWQTAGSRRGSVIAPHPEASSQVTQFDPNDERSLEAVRAWLSRADIYTLPHVVLFDSMEHLVELLDQTDLPALSANISAHHAGLEHHVHAGWKRIFAQLLANRPPASRGTPADMSSRRSSSVAAGGSSGADYSSAMAHYYPELAHLYSR